MGQRSNSKLKAFAGPFVAFIVVVGGLALLTYADSGDDHASAPRTDCKFGMQPPDTTQYESKDLPPPPTGGRIGVVDSLGNRRGTIALADLATQPKEIPSSARPGTFDVPVVDDYGKLVGYVVPEYGGFVDVESARNPEMLAQLVEDSSRVVDSTGHAISAEEFAIRKESGTACLR